MNLRRAWTATGLVAVAAAGLATGSSAPAARGVPWKGAETFHPVALQPNVERCGTAPRNLQATFTGSGIDTAGGSFNVRASGCMDTETFRVTDLNATDTFLRTGDQVRVETDDFTLSYDTSTCVLTTRRSVPFRVAGGTGGLTGATGGGHFDLVMNWPRCTGAHPLPVHVWFEGVLRRPR